MNTQTVSQLFKEKNEVVLNANVSEGAGLEDEGLVCPYGKCGKVFSEPVRLTNLSGAPNVETYYACPYCFSKLNIDGVLGEAEDFGVKKGKSAQKEKDADVKLDKFLNIPECPHHIGYLKSRPSNSAIPDECLTCPKILQCMV